LGEKPSKNAKKITKYFQKIKGDIMNIPNGSMSFAPRADEDEAARKRREMREKLLRGEEVIVTQDGQVEEK
jgi:hypothetical protein